MSQCLHITFFLDGPKNFLHSVVQKQARTLGLEGTVQVVNGQGKSVKILACGGRESIDDFVDLLHKEAARDAIKDIEIEPFIKEKDFRGVFRVIE